MEISVNATTLSDIGLPAGWQWEAPDLSVDNLTSATAIYVGENKDNYKNTTITISLRKEQPAGPNPDNQNPDNPNDNNKDNNDIISNKPDVIPAIIVSVVTGIILISTVLLIIIRKRKK